MHITTTLLRHHYENRGIKQMIEEMGEQTKAIQKDIKAAQDYQKHYVVVRRLKRYFKKGGKVFILVLGRV